MLVVDHVVCSGIAMLRVQSRARKDWLSVGKLVAARGEAGGVFGEVRGSEWPASLTSHRAPLAPDFFRKRGEVLK